MLLVVLAALQGEALAPMAQALCAVRFAERIATMAMYSAHASHPPLAASVLGLPCPWLVLKEGPSLFRSSTLHLIVQILIAVSLALPTSSDQAQGLVAEPCVGEDGLRPSRRSFITGISAWRRSGGPQPAAGGGRDWRQRCRASEGWSAATACAADTRAAAAAATMAAGRGSDNA